MDLFSQDLNPVTGDIGFNPASFGLSLKDIDKAASIKLKAALTSWGLALTQEQYREVLKISETKYQWLDAESWIFDGSVLPDVDMSSKDPWLYLTQEYMGYWTGTEWASYIGNNGNFEFQGNTTNYIRWNGTALDIRWVLQMTDGTSIQDYVSNNSTKPMINSSYDSWTNKYKQWLNTWDLLPYTIPSWATWVYLTSNGLFGVKNWVNQFSIESATGNAMFRGTVYASSWVFTWKINAQSWTFSWSITSSATITWWSLIGSTIKTSNFWDRIELWWTLLKTFWSLGNISIKWDTTAIEFYHNGTTTTWIFNYESTNIPWVWNITWFKLNQQLNSTGAIRSQIWFWWPIFQLTSANGNCEFSSYSSDTVQFSWQNIWMSSWVWSINGYSSNTWVLYSNWTNLYFNWHKILTQ